MMDVVSRKTNELPTDIIIFLENKTSELNKIRTDSEYKDFLKQIVNEGE